MARVPKVVSLNLAFDSDQVTMLASESIPKAFLHSLVKEEKEIQAVAAAAGWLQLKLLWVRGTVVH